MKYNYYFLHGFLGSSSDFKNIELYLRGLESTEGTYSFSLLSKGTQDRLSPKNNFNLWSSNFNDIVKSNSNEDTKNILFGYSMGGRLALHSFCDDSSLWHQIFVASANPGLITDVEKKHRLLWEKMWQSKIDDLNWPDFIKAWNQQDIFKNCLDKFSVKEDFDKEKLKLALTNWSVTNHNLHLQKLPSKKINWLVGISDSKYVTMYLKLKKEFNISNYFELDCGHRIFQHDTLISNVLNQRLSIL